MINNDKLGYDIIYVSSSVTLSLKLLGSKWYLKFWDYSLSGQYLKGASIVNEKGHKQIAELIGMPWEYYRACLEEEDHPVLLMTNVNHWLRDHGVLRSLYSIYIMRDGSGFTFNLKEKI